MKARIIKINPRYPDRNLIKEAAEVLRKGGLVAFPTETVYGIAANSLNKKTIERLYSIKKRPQNKPFTFHIADFKALKGLKIELSEKAQRLIHRFWPGPLTIVAFNKEKEKIGVRMPSNKIAIALIEEAHVPVVAPSANISGNEPAVLVDNVISEIGNSIDMIIDGGMTELGSESTVVDVTVNPFTILREGAISRRDIMSDYHILFLCTGNSCRSVMAKGLLEKFVKEAGLSEKVSVDSAGIASFEGILAAPNTIEVMKEEGIDVSDHKGKGVTVELLRKADIIFVMENFQRDAVLNRLPGVELKVRLLREGEGVSDPIGKPLEEYRRVRNIIKDSVQNIFLELFKKEKDI